MFLVFVLFCIFKLFPYNASFRSSTDVLLLNIFTCSFMASEHGQLKVRSKIHQFRNEVSLCTNHHPALAKRKVFSLLRNCASSSPGHRSSAGIMFHADGHDTAKARGPIVDVRHRGTTRRPDELERRSCCLCNELTGLQRPTRYPGAVLSKQRKAMTHSLKVVRAGN